MTGYPLQYESLKSVLLFMNVDLRLKLLQRIPSIRAAEKAVPLKVDILEFNGSAVQIHNTRYELRVFIPFDVEYNSSDEEDTASWTSTDFDEYGIEENYDDVITPGDIRIPGEKVEEVKKPAIERLMELEKNKKLYEKALELSPQILNQSHESWKTVEDHEEMIMLLSPSRIQWELNDMRRELNSYRRRRDQIPLPFTPLLELKVASCSDGKWTSNCYQYLYTIKLYEARKRLNTLLFENRRLLQVRLLDINDWIRLHKISNYIIRLPEKFKMRIQQLRVFLNVAFITNCLKPIIDESSYPLDALYTGRITIDQEDFESEVVKTARKLFIFDLIHEEPFLPLLKLRNPYVQINGRYDFLVEDQVSLVENWLEIGRKVGTVFRYRVKFNTDWEMLSNQLSNMGGVKYSDKQILLSMPNKKQMEIRYTAFKPDNSLITWNDQDFNVEFRVAAAGNIPFVNGIASINDGTIEEILRLNSSTNAIQLCEEFLMHESKKTIKDKLKISQIHNMENLKNKCISEIRTAEEIAEKSSEIDLATLLQKTFAPH